MVDVVLVVELLAADLKDLRSNPTSFQFLPTILTNDILHPKIEQAKFQLTDLNDLGLTPSLAFSASFL